MKTEADKDLVLNEAGVLDLDYYLIRAREERAKAVRELILGLFHKRKCDARPENKAPIGTMVTG